jgi:hypothetical protein
LSAYVSQHFIEANKQEDRRDKAIRNMPIESNKPYLVIHVGPPKTGTSTLQDAFTKMSEGGIFAKDNYTYLPGYSLDLMSSTCHSHNKTNDDESLSDSLRKVECWDKTLQGLDPYLKNKTNLIFSSETWSFHSIPLTGRRCSMVDWPSVYLTLSRDWNLLVVFAYRRYPEWIFSAKQQDDRWKSTKLPNPY